MTVRVARRSGAHALRQGVGVSGLDLDFANGRYALNSSPSSSFPTGWSFSRTGAGTALTSAGVIVPFATGVPRITDRGLLVEGARTNLLLNSATLVTQSVTVTAVAHTLSFYGTGAVTLSGTSTAGPLVGTGAGNRVTLTFTPTAGTLTLTVTGSVTMAQLEIGSFATSPIITTGAAATRSLDVAENALATSPPAVFVQARLNNFTSGSRVFDLYNVAGLERLILLVNIAGSISAFIQIGGVQTTIGTAAAAATVGVTFKAVVRRNAAGTWRLFVNGVAIGSETAVIAQPAVTAVALGRSQSSTEPLNGSVERFRGFNNAPSDAGIQALTT